MSTTLRHLAMLRRIPRAPAFISTPDLRCALETLDYTVDIRTVQRDIARGLLDMYELEHLMSA